MLETTFAELTLFLKPPFIASCILFFSTWVISVFISDASIVDRIWGSSFAVIALSLLTTTDIDSPRLWAVTTLICIWGFRLSWHIHNRNKGHPEDYRYQNFRRKNPKYFPYICLLTVYTSQMLLSFVVALPILVLFHNPGSAAFPSFFDVIGALVWSLGMIFEVGGDLQLKKFKANPENKNKVLDSGFWGLTRHPNYFGDALQWWGIFLLSLNSPLWYVAVIGPVLMTYLLRNVSGVSLLEKGLHKRKPEYQAYVEGVPAFVPRLWKRKK